MAGTVFLDQATLDLRLDFFVLFSSGAGAVGNPGQADYSTANAFMDAYAEYRNIRVAAKKAYNAGPHGQTLSINWPSWKEGGMKVDAATQKVMIQYLGSIPMQTSTGIKTLYQALTSKTDQMMVMEGDLERLHIALIDQQVGSSFPQKPITKEGKKAIAAATHDTLQEQVANYLKNQLSSVIKLPQNRIEADVQMEKYGIDSIMSVQLTNQLEKVFDSLPKTLFFEYQTLQELAAYFVEYHGDKLGQVIGFDNGGPSIEVQDLGKVLKPKGDATKNRLLYPLREVGRLEAKGEYFGEEPIAIIGLSGRYPGAYDAASFWENLKKGKDCIVEVPKERWDHSLYYDEDKEKMGKSYSKWGGFIKGIDEFDPLFFNISPREAELMDPQERLFLETVEGTLEDAGYGDRRELDILQRERGLGIGVFVGCMYSQYAVVAGSSEINGLLSASSYWSIPNRVSYFFNFQGPSYAVDSACSSSLTAIHMACESIRHGESLMAVAGGVNLSLHPSKYNALSQTRMLGSGSKSKSLGEGDGYIPGEGVGAILLKRFSEAIEDRDSIYGVIRGSFVNHGGKTNGFTVPNPKAQADLIEKALTKAKVDPRTISYIEVAANGSAFGDAIEIAGLKKAFEKFTHEKQFCAIGSVKSNIGHLEAASGISQLTKLVLQCKHRQLAPSLHVEPVNPNLNLEDSAFYIQNELTDWESSKIEENGKYKEYPRRAALSSFGAGGANAHLIFEEYVPEDEGRGTEGVEIKDKGPYLIVLSAKNEDRLKEVARNLHAYLTVNLEPETVNLRDVAYTLQIGRESMEERLVFIVEEGEELLSKLGSYLEDPKTIQQDDRVFIGNMENDRKDLQILIADEAGKDLIAQAFEHQQLNKLALLWAKGIDIPWRKLYQEDVPRRVSLPTYPFEKRRCWIGSQPGWSGSNVIQDKALANNGDIAFFGSSENSEYEPEKGESADAINSKELITVETVEHDLTRLISSLLHLPKEDLKHEKDLTLYGFNSLIGGRLINRLQDRYGLKIQPADLFENQSIARLARYIFESKAGRIPLVKKDQENISENSTKSLEKNGDNDPHKYSETEESKAGIQTANSTKMPCAFPLSAGQMGLWLVEQVAPENYVYNVPIACRVQGEVDQEALKRSFEALLRRHVILRVHIEIRDGDPVQVVDPEESLFFKSENVETLSDTDLHALLNSKTHEPFNLEKGQLMRVHLFCRSRGETILLLTFHHIVFDGISASILLNDLIKMYRAEVTGEAVKLPLLQSTYADFVTWQQQMLASNEGHQHKAYWQEQFSGELPILELPTDYARPLVQIYKGLILKGVISQEVIESLKALVQRENVNLFTLLLTAFKVLLHRYTQQEDIIVGTPLAGRSCTAFEEIIGYFVNMVAIRSHVESEMAFDQLLKQVQSGVFNGLEHGDYPFSELVKDLDLRRNRSHSPVFQVAFIFQNWIGDLSPVLSQEEEERSKQLVLKPIDEIHQAGEFDLSLEAIDMGTEFCFYFNYNPDLFERATIERMMSHFEVFLAGIVKNSKSRISQLPLLTEAERQQILVEWNDSSADYSRDKCIHELFEEQVRTTPENIAVVYEEERLTYSELNDQANQLAHYLVEQGVAPDTLVGLCVERSLELIIAILGILKSGGAYVPLDPGYPQKRLQYMAEDGAVHWIVTLEKFKGILSDCQAEFVCLDDDNTRQVLAKHSTDNILANAIRLTPQALAYVIYTSGSTGTPKGVLLTHAGLVNLGVSQAKLFRVNTASRVLQFASVSFDAATWEWVMALSSGAQLYVYDDEVIKSGDLLSQAVHRDQITHATLPPTLLPELDGDYWKSVEHLVVAGESCSQGTASLWSENRRLFNAYGPSETTVCASVGELDHENPCVHIGRPLPGVTMVVLDNQKNPVPIGITGELYIGGIGLAKEYLNRPELTAEKFIQNPFSDNADDRLYRTGDLGRWLVDGTIEFLGRIDDQVKIRGFRIELGEIESQLNHHSAIQNNVVIVKEQQGHKQLIANYVLEKYRTVDPTDLKAYLAQHLPDYMIPVAFIELEAIPLTPNGKVDRKKLLMQDIQLHSTQAYVAPRNEIEQKLVEIWQDVLNRKTVGIRDNFFELGGDSILCIQIVNKARQHQIDVTVQKIFQHQTIEALNSLGYEESKGVAEQGVLEGQAPLLPIQQWFFRQSFAQQHHWNQSVLLTLRQPIRLETLRDVIKRLMDHHDALRFIYQNDNGHWQQTYGQDFNSEDLVEHYDVSSFAKETQLKKIEAYCNGAQKHLNLTAGPLIKTVLFTLGPKKSEHEMPQWLFIVIHHLAVDGVSWRIILEDLQTALIQKQSGQVIQFPPKTTSYRYWGQQLTEYANTETFQRQISYWRDQPWDRAGSIPCDLKAAKGANLESTVRHIELQLSQSHTKQLLEEAGQAYNTRINDMLLAALAYAYQRWTGQERLFMMLEGHGREALFDDVDVSRTVGWFTSMFPVILSIGSSLEDTLKITKETLRHIPQNGLGYGMMHHLTREPALQTIVEPELVFNYLGQFGQIESKESLFGGTKNISTSARSPQAHRFAVLDINGMINQQQLTMTFSYSNRLHKKESIQRFADAYQTALCRIIEHCLQPERGGYTPSDFPLISLGQTELDVLMLKLATEQSIPVRKNIESIYPLSPLQQGILFETLLSPDSGMYIVQLSLLLQGKLDIKAMKKAWQAVVNRHASLRTGFVYEEQKEPLQIVYKVLNFNLEYLDWRTKSKSDQKKSLAERVAENKKTGFKLQQAPLVKVSIIQTAEDEFRLLYCNHHLILDGWSLPILFRDVFLTYQAYRKNLTPQFKPGIPYQNYIEWIKNQNQQRAEHFWKDYLNDFSEATPILPRLSATSTQQPRQIYNTETNTLGPQISEQLKQLGQTQRVTLNSILQTAWGILLGKYADKEVVIFGGVSSGRQPEVLGSETMVGLLINTLPVQVYCQAETTAIEAIKNLHQREIEKRQFEYTPLTDIQKWLGITKNEELFKTLFVFENYPLEPGDH